MCGATQQQTDISDEQQDFYKQLTAQYGTIFGQSQTITGALTSAFTPILNAGPSQTGFSPSQDTAMRTQNTENVATNYAQAQKATAQILAAQGGGNTLLPSSTSANLLASNANAAAAARSQGELAITNANYAQGYKNWQSAAGVLSGTAGLLNPNAYSSSATGAGGAAATTANQIAQENTSPWTAAIGALGGITGAALGNWGSIFPGSSTPGTQYLSAPNPLVANYNATQMMPPPSLYTGAGMPSQVPSI
jgi:hypothetical protein